MFLNKIQNYSEIAGSLNKLCLNLTSDSKLRQNCHDFLQKPQLIDSRTDTCHLFEKLEDDITTEIQNIFNVKVSVICTDCCKTICNHEGGVHVYLFVATSQDLCNDISVIIRSNVAKKHGLYVPEVIFLDTDITELYRCSQCTGKFEIHRFHFRDDFYTGKLANNVKLVSKSDSSELCTVIDILHANGRRYSKCCFGAIESEIEKPLSWRNFQLVEEWLLEIPLPIQIFFGRMFINSESIKRSDVTTETVIEKIARLYICLDACLNNLNRNHNGVFQQMNTEELMVNYHSIGTVFNITSQGGVSRSLKSADRWLQKTAEPEISYYETYLKKYPLFFDRIGEIDAEEHLVSMQDCFIILYLDNLVRLTTHRDPSPGQTRTSQICTLPKTLKGLPRDSKIVSFWHEEGCEMESECLCTQDRKLNKDEFNLLIQNTQAEDIAINKLSTQTIWGICTIVNIDTIKEHVNIKDLPHDMDDMLDISKELDDFNDTLHSLLLQNELEENDVCKSNIGGKDILEISTNASIYMHDTFEIKSNDEGAQLQIDEASFDKIIDEDEFRRGIDLKQDEHHTGHSFDHFDNSLDLFDSKQYSPTKKTIDHSIYMQKFQNLHDNEQHVSLYNTEKSIDMESYFFQDYLVSPLLCRHPIPGTGRDDDRNNLRKILVDILTKLGKYSHLRSTEKILFAPDYKISKNLIEFVKEGGIYKQFLPEFPLLHLRKSKIVNLFSAYKEAGLFHLFKYMKDNEQEKDWMQLISLQNIDTATNNIKRLSIGLHLAFILKFLETLPESQAKDFIKKFDLGSIQIINHAWRPKFNEFLEAGKDRNATFALHVDMMQHMDEIVGILMAERLGGPQGYDLLLGCVKSSLPFSFLNGATSYASFCSELLHLHYTSGHFYRCLKSSLFTTPHKGSSTKFALDTQREIDHRDAIKGFRPRSTLNTVVPRLTIVDRLVEAEHMREQILASHSQSSRKSKSDESKSNEIQYDLVEKELKFILPITKIVLQESGLCLEPNEIPFNVYHRDKIALSPGILDKESYNFGKYLIHKYCCSSGLFGLSKHDILDISNIEGDKPLKQKTKSSKGTTIRRTSIKSKLPKTEYQKEEDKRKQENIKKGKFEDCMSSKMNTCQALFKPDCTKPTVPKSLGIKKAIIKLFSFLKENSPEKSVEEILKSKGLIVTGQEIIPDNLKKTISIATLEFAGVKFKSRAASGKENVSHINTIINSLIHSKFPSIRRLVISEEKYSFTPDDLKSSTRAKRQKEKIYSITHLKHGNEIVSEEKLSKSAVIETTEGKCLISNYLARNVSQLDIKHNIILDIDSELVISEAKDYCTPVRAKFSSEHGFVEQVLLDTMKQSKGEAEMAQVDWLINCHPDLQQHEAALSIVTSGDIDSIYVHMFALSLHWPRGDDGKFLNKVYILLQKQVPDLYDITAVIEQLEDQYGYMICVSLAICLCMGGNDFIPKFSHITHEKWVSLLMLEEPILLQNLIDFDMDKVRPGVPKCGSINTEVFVDVVKRLYCPDSLDVNKLSFEHVRQFSIQPFAVNAKIKHPTYWMPPKSALEQLVKLINCQITYLFMLGKPDAKLPDFSSLGPFQNDSDGNIAYDFGPEVRINNLNEVLSDSYENLKHAIKQAKKVRKRKSSPTHCTPKKKKKPMTTPMVSTPK